MDDSYIIVDGLDVTADDIEQARQLDRLVYDEEYFVSLQQCLQWYERNHHIYTMIKDAATGSVIAYVNLSPVTDEYYERIRSGDFVDTYLPPEAIVDYDFPDVYNLYFSSIVVHPRYQGTTILFALFNAIASKFLALGREEIIIRRMVADAVSDKGAKFCRLFGMTKLKGSSHDSEIYEVTMLPPAFRQTSKATRELYALYRQKAEEMNMSPRAAGGKREGREMHDHPVGKVFISHSSKDLETAVKVCAFLENNGVECWLAPRNIDPGANYATQIVQSIRSCSAMVLLASDNTNSSGHVSNEVSLAFDNKKLIVPFKIQDIVFTDEYLYFLGRKHWIEAHLNFQEGLAQLLSTMETAGIAVKPRKKEPPIPEKPPAPVKKPTPPVAAPAGRQEQEPAAALDRDGVIGRILKQAKRYSEKSIHYLEDCDDFTQRMRRSNRFLNLTYTVFRHNKRVETDDCIGYLLKELLGDDEEEVVKVSGLPGTGKSILLQSAFYQALTLFQQGSSPYLPFYVGLGYYEKLAYGAGQSAQKLKAEMKKDMAFFFDFAEKQPDSVVPVFFIDEVREHSIGRIFPENVLAEILEEHRVTKRVVSIDTGLVQDKHKLKRVIPIFSERISSSFISHQVDLHDERLAMQFIESITALFDYDIPAEEVFSSVKKLKYQEIDVYTVRSIADELAASPAGVSNISDIYEKWTLTELRGSEERMFQVAESTYSYLFGAEHAAAPEQQDQWRLIHKHRSYIDFLLAYYLIRQVGAYASGADTANYFLPMLTASTDRFLSAYFGDNYALQEKILDAVTENFDSFGVVQKSSALFWLAKLTFKSLVADAVDFLRRQFAVLKPMCKTVDDTTQTNYDNQFLFRAVCFSLIVHGQDDVLDDYLCMLVTNDSTNAINRGAIVEYYGDQYQMAINGTYDLDADPMAGKTAIRALNWKVTNALRRDSSKYPELDLLTLSTLLQTRVQSDRRKQPEELALWVKDIVEELNLYRSRPQNIKSEKIEFYFGSVYEDFNEYLKCPTDFDIGRRMYGQLRKLGEVKRKQWAERGFEDIESVSEHIYSAWMLAMLFLPQNMERDDYSKKEILDMLLIHDMAEAVLGDQVLTLSEPSHELRAQNSVMRKLFVKGSYSSLANLTYYYNVWTGYYKGLNINAKIARDINVIQTAYTFCEQCKAHPERFSEEEMRTWRRCKRMLQTNQGYEIYERVIENNDDFNGIL